MKVWTIRHWYCYMIASVGRVLGLLKEGNVFEMRMSLQMEEFGCNLPAQIGKNYNADNQVSYSSFVSIRYLNGNKEVDYKRNIVVVGTDYNYCISRHIVGMEVRLGSNTLDNYVPY